jgi:hypothetical protein
MPLSAEAQEIRTALVNVRTMISERHADRDTRMRARPELAVADELEEGAERMHEMQKLVDQIIQELDAEARPGHPDIDR